MHLFRYSIFFGLLVASQTYASPYVIDSASSYLEVDYPTWVQKEGWDFTQIDEATGEVTVLGYYWEPTVRTERYGVSGTFDLIQHPELTSEGLYPLSFENTNLVYTAPENVDFGFPGFMGVDPATGDIGRVFPSCPSMAGWLTSCFISLGPEYLLSTISGRIDANVLTLTGIRQTGPAISYSYSLISLEAPPEPVLTDPPVRYHIVAMPVPEPSNALFMVAGLPLIYLTRRRIQHFSR